MISFNIYEYVFPIYGGRLVNGNFTPIQLCGTASRLNYSLFITAAHSIKSAITFEDCAIGILNSQSKQFSYFIISEYNLYDDLDLGTITIHLNFSWEIANFFKVSREPLNLLDDVFVVGYPHGLDLLNGVLISRALKGYIVNHFPFREFPKAPMAYELSFQCPVGISGAPLLKKDSNSNEITVHGYIVGNSSTEIPTFYHKEIDKENNLISIYERTETTKFGVAIDIKGLESFGELNLRF